MRGKLVRGFVKAAKRKAPKKPETVLVLRTCAADMTSHGGFRWPEKGKVEAPDWDPVPECGNGLHGFLWGEGDGSLASFDASARWLVVSVEADAVVELEGKVKFPRGTVLHCGDRLTATTYLAEHGGRGRAIVGGTSTSGDGGTSTSGYGGTSTSGDGGTSTSGERGEIRIRWWDGHANRYRTEVGYVGEGGIEPNVPYRLDEARKFVEVTS